MSVASRRRRRNRRDGSGFVVVASVLCLTVFAFLFIAPKAFSATNYTSALGADAQVATNNTFVDGPTITIATSGDWLITAHATFERAGSSVALFTARINDGTSNYASGECVTAATNSYCNVSVSTIVTVSSSTTFKWQFTCDSGSTNCKMKAATPTNGSGNNASRISAAIIAPATDLSNYYTKSEVNGISTLTNFYNKTTIDAAGYLTNTTGDARYWQLSNPIDATITNDPLDVHITNDPLITDCPDGGCEAGAGGGGGGEVSFDSAASDKLNLMWWGQWALVGLALVLIIAPQWYRAWGIERKIA